MHRLMGTLFFFNFRHLRVFGHAGVCVYRRSRKSDPFDSFDQTFASVCTAWDQRLARRGGAYCRHRCQREYSVHLCRAHRYRRRGAYGGAPRALHASGGTRLSRVCAVVYPLSFRAFRHAAKRRITSDYSCDMPVSMRACLSSGGTDTRLFFSSLMIADFALLGAVLFLAGVALLALVREAENPAWHECGGCPGICAGCPCHSR